MKKVISLNSVFKTLCVGIAASMLVIAADSDAQAKWNYGIGLGPTFLALDGDLGMGGTVLGTVVLDVDMDFSDVNDAVDTALGFGGYATDGTWMVRYKIGKLSMESDTIRGVSGTTSYAFKSEFDKTEGELTVGYNIISDPSVTVEGYGGVRYIGHEWENTLTTATTSIKSIDESWTDFLIGASVNLPFAQNWSCNIMADAGFGGTEGTYSSKVGVTWRFYGNWSATGFGAYKAVDVEESTRGANDWYSYDIDETTAGITILYNW